MRFVALILALMLATPAWAVLPQEQLADPALEARARAISRELRCVVCQNQTIDESDATLAHDLRMIVRERLVAGDSDEEVKAWIVARYGDYVLMRPPFRAETWLLWLGPALVVLLGGIGVAFYLRSRRPADAVLSAEEQAQLDSLLKKDGPA
jgi:cytochrome c-type biogenesis protein CcmH